jgi:hypothetical protein
VWAPFWKVADQLRKVLGARLTAYIAGVRETSTIHEWAGQRAGRVPSEAVQRRLRVALQAALVIGAADGSEVAQAWFQGLNPQLDDRSPARLLRDGGVEQTGPAVLGAARAFLVEG